ncbi:MAG: 5'-Nucleotidase domain protein [Ignavibacteria bacterium]|nr:5'-Nucleotidase domain protein [Ignavibacteria bacterium]
MKKVILKYIAILIIAAGTPIKDAYGIVVVKNYFVSIPDSIYFDNRIGNQGNFLNFDALVFSKKSDELLIDDKEPPVPRWNMDSCSGNISGIVTDAPDGPGNSSNLGSITFFPDLPDSYNYQFSTIPSEFKPGELKSCNWYLKIKDPNDYAKAKIKFSDAVGNFTILNFVYFPFKTAIEPTYHNFGLVAKDSGKQTQFHIWNLSDSRVARILNIKLKDGAKGFSISKIHFPFTLEPQTDTSFYVNFRTSGNGRFVDSIGVEDECGLTYKAMVEAVVDEPIIEAEDNNFADANVHNSIPADLFIYNRGNADLIIYDTLGPFTPSFKAILFNDFPIIIKPHEQYQYQVNFIPVQEGNLQDSLIFKSNAPTIDSIAIFKGKGINPGITTTPLCEWGRRRIHRPFSFPIIPYSHPTGIVLRNESKDYYIVYNISEISSNKKKAFIFKDSSFIKLDLPPGSIITVPVRFFPQDTGEHEYVFEYNTIPKSYARTRLHGFGTVPKIKCNDVDFDSTIIQDEFSKSQKTIKISNPSLKEWKYGDTLHIFDIVAEDNFQISTSSDTYGSEGFKFDKSKLKFPISLLPGQDTSFDAFFLAQKAGTASAAIVTRSDAVTDSRSVWSGYGLVLGIKLQGGEVSTCLRISDTINCKLENFGSAPITIDRIRFSPPMIEFSLVNDSELSGFSILPASSKDIIVVFHPDVSSSKTTTLIADIHSENLPFVSAKLIGNTRVDNYSASLEPVNQDVLIGESFEKKIFINKADNIASYSIKTLTANIEYNPQLIQMVSVMIDKSSALYGKFNIKKLEIDNLRGSATFDIVSIIGSEISALGEMASIFFLPYLPQDTTNGTDIKLFLSSPETTCLAFTAEKSEIGYKPFCQSDFRRVIFSDKKYSLGDIAPNPITDDIVSFNYTVALPGKTWIFIYDILGRKVATIIDEEVGKGDYKANIPIREFPSGLYWCSMKSGPFSALKTFYISK